MKAAVLVPSQRGPVSISQLPKFASRLMRAVAGGETVPISNRGVIVAVFLAAQPQQIMDLAKVGDPDQELSAREIEHGNPSPKIARAAKGEHFALTFRNRPIGLLAPVGDWKQLSALADPSVFGDPSKPMDDD